MAAPPDAGFATGWKRHRSEAEVQPTVEMLCSQCRNSSSAPVNCCHQHMSTQPQKLNKQINQSAINPLSLRH
jgi:hypothetical protein